LEFSKVLVQFSFQRNFLTGELSNKVPFLLTLEVRAKFSTSDLLAGFFVSCSYVLPMAGGTALLGSSSCEKKNRL
jgi:hypothetical protein